MTGLKLTSNNYLMPLYVYQKWKRKSIFKVNITLLIFFFEVKTMVQVLQLVRIVTQKKGIVSEYIQ